MRFNKSVDLNNSSNVPFVGKLTVDVKDSHSLVAVDTLKIDRHFRITFTKEVRNILPLKQGDTIALYTDGEKGDLLLKLQRDSKIVDTLRITRERTVVNNNVSVKLSGQHSRVDIESKTNLNQRGSSQIPDKVTELTGPRYYVDDPLKRYFPNIVLIDDDRDILLTYESALSIEGFNVQTFPKSEEAVKYLTSHQGEHRIVITDIRMPGINGIELYRMLKSANMDIKVIFVTALDAAAELLSIFPEIKSQDIIGKPVEITEFVNKVKAAIFN